MAIRDLFRARTRPEIMTRILNALGRPDLIGLPVTDWNNGGVTRTIAEISAEAIADTERVVQRVGEGGYLFTAGGEWLDALVESQYGLTRQEAAFARGMVILRAAPGIGDQTLDPGLIVSTASNVTYTTLDPVVIPQGGTASVRVQADEPGSQANVAPAAIKLMNTPLPGVSVTNEPGWLTQAGADRETDDALRVRARTRWPTLGGGMTRAAYVNIGLSVPAVQQVLVLDQHPRGQGTVDVILWGAGGLGAADVDAVNMMVQERRPLTADVLVYSAAERNLVIQLSLYAPALNSAQRTAVEAELETAFNVLAINTPIGGRLFSSQIIETAMTPAGVLDVIRTDSNEDVILSDAEGLTIRTIISWRNRA